MSISGLNPAELPPPATICDRMAAQTASFGRIVPARFLKLETRSSAEGQWYAAAAEIKPVLPTPEVRIDGDGNARVSGAFDGQGLVVRCTLDGRLPTARSAVFEGRVSVPRNGVFIARYFADGFEGPPAWAIHGTRRE